MYLAIIILYGTGLRRGNVVLGVVLHYIRVMILFVIFPIVSDDDRHIVLLVWSATEVFRYPMYRPTPMLEHRTILTKEPFRTLAC